jgi:arylsulfatase A-like enzyme
MNRQDVLLRARPLRALGRLAGLVLSTCLLAALAAVPAAARPNIVFVLTDDLDWRSMSRMPRVQALAAGGATFARAYAATPMCVPARATLLTGKYPQNTGTRSNRPPAGGFQSFFANGQEQDTFAVWLRRAGYRTALIGKYLNFYPETAPALHVPPGWSHWLVPEHNRYMHAKFNYRLNEDGRSVAYGGAAADYATDVYAAKARAFIARSADEGRPFALLLSFPSPHVRENPAPRHQRWFPDAQAPRPASFPELDMSDKPPFLRLAPLQPERVEELDKRYRKRLRMLQSIDEAVASIRDLLVARGLLDDTYLVFSSDHGWHQGQHNQPPGKGRAFEEDTHVPLVVAGPGVRTGRTIERLVSNADFAPTFAAWAGVAPGPEVDGRSFAPLLTAADPARVPWRKRMPLMRLTEGVAPRAEWPELDVRREGAPQRYGCLAHLPPSRTSWPEYRGLRTERSTYVEYASGDLELYDRVRDPFQLQNAICNTTPTQLTQLHRTTEALFTCKTDGCRKAEDW